jgi:putative ABC transport system substrate-binding protein
MSLKRRDFITLLGSAAACPIAARAQPAPIKRVGLLMTLTPDDPEDQARLAAFLQGLQENGWSVGRDLRIETRWGAGDPDRFRRSAIELAALAPDVILTIGGLVVLALQQATQTVPIVFALVTDPVGSGLVESLARPGGNTTGFTNFEFSAAAKWLALLKEIAPRANRVAEVRSAGGGAQIGTLAAIQTMAPTVGVEASALSFCNTDEIERSIAEFARSPNGGLIVMPAPETIAHRNLLIELADRHRLPAIYAYRFSVAAGGLISYGVDSLDLCRRAAGYADRILRGAKPSDLPVQAPTKYELVINLKTAKALGLTVPPTMLALADEVLQ